MKSPDQINMGKRSAASKSARRLALLILLLLVMAIAVMTWKWAEDRGYIANFEHALMRYLDEADVFSSRTRTFIAEVESRKSETEQQLNQLAANLLAIDNQRSATEKLDQVFTGNDTPDGRILGAVKRLIMFSDQYLQLTGDVQAALGSLEQASQLLQASEALRTSRLSDALSRDIDKTRVAATVDIIGIYQRIETLTAQVERLPLAMDSHLILVDIAGGLPDSAASSLWQRYLNEVLQDFFRLIKVEKIADPNVLLLSNSQSYLLREHIRLQMTLTRLALLTRDEGNFRSSLKTAIDWMDRYFDTDAQSVENTLKELEQISAINMSVRLPDFRESLEAVDHEQLMLKGEDE